VSGTGFGKASKEHEIFVLLVYASYNDSMTRITIDDMQRDLKSYLHRVEAGETIVILDADKPVAEIKPIGHRPNGQRPFGLCAGKFTVQPNFDEPLDEDMLRRFEGK